MVYQIEARKGDKVLSVEDFDQPSAREKIVDLVLKEFGFDSSNYKRGWKVCQYEKQTNDKQGGLVLYKIIIKGFYELNKIKTKLNFNGYEFSFKTITKEFEVELKPITKEELAKMGYYLMD